MVRALTLLNLLLKRAQRLVGGAAGSAHQGRGTLHQHVQVLVHKALLQLDEVRRVVGDLWLSD